MDFTVEGYTLNYDGGLTSSLMLRRITGIPNPLDEFFMDTGLHTSVGSNGKQSNITLNSGQTYSVAVRGTWTWNWFGTWPVLYPGVNTPKSPVHADPEWTQNDGSGHRSYCVISLNNQASYSHIEPVGGQPTAYDPDHLYIYSVVGQGFPLHIGTGDTPIHDNYGSWRVFIFAGNVNKEQVKPLYGI